MNQQIKKYPSVNLASGGLDSFLVWSLFARDSINLFVDIGHKYAETEKAALAKLKKEVDGFKVAYTVGPAIGKLERKTDGYIPYRNAELILSAAQYSNIIYFGAMKHDSSPDKSPSFFNTLGIVLDHSNLEHKHSVHLPGISYTKTELVRRYIQEIGEMRALLMTRSCYSGKEYHCGNCHSCFNRWAAFVNNDIEEYYIKSPMLYAKRPDIQNKINVMPENKKADILSAIRKA